MTILMEPWVDMPTARSVLRWLVGDGLPDGRATSNGQLAAWLMRQGLGALAYGRCQGTDLALRHRLQGDMFSAAAESSLKQARLQVILEAMAAAKIPLVLLKGVALSLTVYDDPAWRTMSDMDFWIQDAAMADAARVMAGLGYTANVKGERPFALQRLSGGEIKFIQPGMQTSLVEFHWSAFPGWWLTRTAAVDEAGVWARRQPLADSSKVFQLSPEDMVIQLAVHTAVNHQFGMSALRSLVDIALMAEKRGVDWAVVAERANAWQVETVLYTVLDLLDQLIGAEGLDVALNVLRPAPWRMHALRRFVTPESVLAGRDLRSGGQRFLLLLLLVDRWRDMGKLVLRTLWPERDWLEARYGDDTGHWQHLWQVVRHGSV